MTDLVERARAYLAANAAESGADVLISEMAAEIERLRTGARESVAAWMIQRSYATGHGDTIDDLLVELEAQARQRPASAERQHEWFTYGRLNWECCRVCGIVRRMDGKNSPCKGPAAVGPRETIHS